MRGLSALAYGVDDLRHDILDPRIWVRARGDVLVLAEDLEPHAAMRFVRGLSDVASLARHPADAYDFVDYCRELLGAGVR